jgi:S-formylglutathione hydrolase
MVKAGAQRYAAQHGLILVTPDTSPRGEGVPDDEVAWDFGKGAGFYLNAVKEPWSKHYHMYDYLVEELPGLIEATFPVDAQRKSISGHSMGGHGALTIALKNPRSYRSVSAFSPIVAPTQCAWGEKAFLNYLGEDRSLWQQYDAVSLIERQGARFPREILIDQGEADSFLLEQLKVSKMQEACDAAGQPLSLRMHADYDHSYYFIASFIGEHIAFHAEALRT